jgi:hypothetical protein
VDTISIGTPRQSKCGGRPERIDSLFAMKA